MPDEDPRDTAAGGAEPPAEAEALPPPDSELEDEGGVGFTEEEGLDPSSEGLGRSGPARDFEEILLDPDAPDGRLDLEGRSGVLVKSADGRPVRLGSLRLKGCADIRVEDVGIGSVSEAGVLRVEDSAAVFVGCRFLGASGLDDRGPIHLLGKARFERCEFGTPFARCDIYVGEGGRFEGKDCVLRGGLGVDKGISRFEGGEISAESGACFLFAHAGGMSVFSGTTLVGRMIGALGASRIGFKRCSLKLLSVPKEEGSDGYSPPIQISQKSTLRMEDCDVESEGADRVVSCSESNVVLRRLSATSPAGLLSADRAKVTIVGIRHKRTVESKKFAFSIRNGSHLSMEPGEYDGRMAISIRSKSYLHATGCVVTDVPDNGLFWLFADDAKAKIDGCAFHSFSGRFSRLENGSEAWFGDCSVVGCGGLFESTDSKATVVRLEFDQTSSAEVSIFRISGGSMHLEDSTLRQSGPSPRPAVLSSKASVASRRNRFDAASSPVFHLDGGRLDSRQDDFPLGAVRVAVLSDGAESNLPVPLDEDGIRSALGKLDGAPGMASAKAAIRSLVEVSRASILKESRPSSHMRLVFSGKLGTGRGFLSSIAADLYQALGLVPSSRVAVLSTESWAAARPAPDSPWMALKGNVVLIRDPNVGSSHWGDGQAEEALRWLGSSTLVILSGTPDGLADFARKSPRVMSRFTKTIHFADPSEDDLVSILARRLGVLGMELSAEAAVRAKSWFAGRGSMPSACFPNALSVDPLASSAIERHAERILAAHGEGGAEIRTIEACDIQDVQEVDGPPRKDLSVLMAELEAMVGLASIKKAVRRLVALAKANRRRGSTDLDVSLHLVFEGNPGTGKTTVARLVGGIYRALGLLPSGHLVEVDRSEIVGKFVGSTAPLVRDAADRARGGILFIDEAYSLNARSTNDFGHEAVSTLLKLMEDRRKDFAVILAGTPDLMQGFMEMNSGLSSRFRLHMEFQDYSLDDLSSILLGLWDKHGFSAEEGTMEAARRHLAAKMKREGNGMGFMAETLRGGDIEPKERRESFGNAREARSLFEFMLEVQALRLEKDASANPWLFVASDVEDVPGR